MRTRGVIFLISMTIGVLAMPASALAVNPTAARAPAARSAPARPTAPAAAPSGADPGSNLATWLKSWVGALFSVVVGVVGLGAVAKRSVGEGLALLLVALIVGGFVIAPDAMNSLTQNVWAKVAG
jgi:hypothetical protein